MTPRKAIKIECQYCNSNNRLTCESGVCKLNDTKLSPLKRIRGHCLDCARTSRGVADCAGNVLSPEPHKCFLWEYRLGTNPERRGIGRKGGNPGINIIKKGLSQERF